MMCGNGMRTQQATAVGERRCLLRDSSGHVVEGVAEIQCLADRYRLDRVYELGRIAPTFARGPSLRGSIERACARKKNRPGVTRAVQ